MKKHQGLWAVVLALFLVSFFAFGGVTAEAEQVPVLYSISTDANLSIIDSETGLTIYTIPITFNDTNVTVTSSNGGNGLASTPDLLSLYALIRVDKEEEEEENVQVLATIDPISGIATEIGETLTGNYQGIAFATQDDLYAITDAARLLKIDKVANDDGNIELDDAFVPVQLTNDGAGESIAFTDANDLTIYHISGPSDGDGRLFESYDLSAVGDDPKFTQFLVQGNYKNARSLTYWDSEKGFLHIGEISGGQTELFSIKTEASDVLTDVIDANVTSIGNTDLGSRGLARLNIEDSDIGANLNINQRKGDLYDPIPKNGGYDLTYSIEVINLGPQNATEVSLTDTLPESITFKSASDGCTHDADLNVVTCNLGNISRNATKTINITGMPTSSERITNFAKVQGKEIDPDINNNIDYEDTLVNSLTFPSQLMYSITNNNLTSPDDSIISTLIWTGTGISATGECDGDHSGPCAGSVFESFLGVVVTESNSGNTVNVYSLAIDPTDGKVYATISLENSLVIDGDPVEYYLATIDPLTGVATTIDLIQVETDPTTEDVTDGGIDTQTHIETVDHFLISDIAFTPDGTLYGVGETVKVTTTQEADEVVDADPPADPPIVPSVVVEDESLGSKLSTIDKTTAAPTEEMELSGSGSIAYNTNDGFMYHAYGATSFEYISLTNKTVQDIPILGSFTSAAMIFWADEEAFLTGGGGSEELDLVTPDATVLGDADPSNNFEFDHDSEVFDFALSVPFPEADLSTTISSTSLGTVNSMINGENLTYDTKAINGGPNTAEGVFIDNFIPDEYEFVSASDGCSLIEGDFEVEVDDEIFDFTQKVNCLIGELTNGASAEKEVVVMSLNPAEDSSIFSLVSGQSNDPDESNNLAELDVTVVEPSQGHVLEGKIVDKQNNDKFDITLKYCSGLDGVVGNLSSRMVKVIVGPLSKEVPGSEFKADKNKFTYKSEGKPKMIIKLYPDKEQVKLKTKKDTLDGIENPIEVQVISEDWACVSTETWNENIRRGGTKTKFTLP